MLPVAFFGAVTLFLLGIGIPLAFGSPVVGIVMVIAAVPTGGYTIKRWLERGHAPEAGDEAHTAARRAARRVVGELQTSRSTAQEALDNGHFWYVMLTGLQSDEWHNGRDALSDCAPKAANAASEAYVQVDRLNAAANVSYASDIDELSDEDRRTLTTFVDRSERAIRELQNYVG